MSASGLEVALSSLNAVNERSGSSTEVPSNTVQMPLSLRSGLMAATCLATAFAANGANAQQNNGQLPALNVEAPAEVRRARPAPRPAPRPVIQRRATRAPARAQPTPRVRPRPEVQQAAGPSTPAPADPSQVQGAGAGSGAGGPGGAPGANPYANPNAPYQVQRLSGNKVTEPLINTPRTVTAIPKEVIQDKGATSFRELMRTTPGVTLGTGEGGNAYGDRVFVRGFDTRNDVYVDGVRDPGVGIRETFQMEQVEILKGPSSTIGGRGTTGGAINLVTKKPFFQNLHEIEFTGGTDATRRVTFDINRVLTDTLAIRAVGMGQLANVAGRDNVFDNRLGGLFAITWKPTDKFKLTLDYQHVELDQMPDWGVPTDPRTKMPATESGLRRNTFYGNLTRDFQRAKQDIFSATAEVNLTPWLVLTSKLRQGRSLLDYVVTAPESPNFSDSNPANWTVRAAPKSRHQITDILANQTDLTAKFATFTLLHTLVAGVEISREDLTRGNYGLSSEVGGGTVVNNLAGEIVNLWNPQPTPFAGPLAIAPAHADVRIDTKSAYVLDTINWREKIFLTAGLRFDDYSTRANNFSSAGAITSLKSHAGLWNYNVGLTYKILPTWAVYAAYGTSSNPVGADLDGGAADYGALVAANATLPPERNTSKEAGTKIELFDRKLLATAAVFETTKENARETSGVGAAATITAVGAYRVRGAEFSLAGKVTEKWSLSGGMVFLETAVTRSNNAAFVGLKLANIAEHSYNLLTKYQLTDRFTLGGQVTIKDKLRGGTFAASTGAIAPGGLEHARLDVFAEYEFAKGIVGKLAVYNLTNAVIYDSFYRSAAPFVYLAPGRSATASVRFKF